MRYGSYILTGVFLGSLAAPGVVFADGKKPAAEPQKTAAAAPAPAAKEEPKAEMATAELMGADGKKVGDVSFEETPHGVLISANLFGLPPGPHAFHIHETGVCTAPDFKSAKGHFNPTGKKHGLRSVEGMHCGDLPNVEIPAAGTVSVQVLADGVTLKAGQKSSLLDADGSALVLHKVGDDYKTDPAGAAGDRIACGVIAAKK